MNFQEKATMFHDKIKMSSIANVFNHERYTGVVYNHIDWRVLQKNQQYEYIIIFSGLFGLLTPDTLIPDYKLKMNVLSLKIMGTYHHRTFK